MMPNHVQSKLEFYCSEERLKEILSTIQYDDNREQETYGIGTLDFNKIIPRPSSLNIESGGRTDRGLKSYKEFVSQYFFDQRTANADLLNISSEYESQYLKSHTDISSDDWTLGKTAFQNQQKYGATTWYEWSVANWGTKWNSYSNFLDEKTLCFQTAWSAPHPIIEKLSAMYPDVEMKHMWADEDLGNNCGYAVYKDGECIEEDNLETDMESLEYALGVWGYDAESMGMAKNSTSTSYIYIEDEKYALIDVAGQLALFANERITEADIPQGLFVSYLRDSDDGENFASLEPKVDVNLGGSVITSEPFDFGENGYIELTDENSPNFIGEDCSIMRFMKGDFEQQGDIDIE